MNKTSTLVDRRQTNIHPFPTNRNEQVNYKGMKNLFLPLISLLLATTVYNLPVNSDTETKDPQTVAGKLLKLALKEADRLKERKQEVEEFERKGMVVQKKDGLRHDRAWALSKKKKDKKTN